MLKKILTIISLVCLCQYIQAEENKTLQPDEIIMKKLTVELKEKYKMKEHHSRLSMTCLDCHNGQGDDPSKFKAANEKACLLCHGTKKELAFKLQFMDTLKANPHNSVHDGPNLYCDECHREHEKSTNMCSECHEKEVPMWMGVTP